MGRKNVEMTVMKKIILLILICAAAVPALMAECRRDSVKLTYKLHGQTRRFNVVFTREDTGALRMDWAIERNLKMWRGSYTMTPAAVASATAMSYLMPEDGKHIVLPDGETFAVLSRDAFDALRRIGLMHWGGTDYRLTETKDGRLYAADINEGAQICVLDDPEFPLVLSMTDNPLEINWTAERLNSSP